MDGVLVRAGVDPHSTTLSAWCSAVWSAFVELMATGIKTADVEKLWQQVFDFPDTGADGGPDRDTWGLLPEHVAGQQRVMDALQRGGGE